MKKTFAVLLLSATVLLAACQSAPVTSTTVPTLTPLVPLEPVVTLPEDPDVVATDPPEPILEVPGRVYDVPWQDRVPLAEGGFAFSDSTIPLFLFSPEEIDDALTKVEAYIEKELLSSEGAIRYTDILGIAPDFLASSEFVSPENRKLEGIEKANWAQENYYAHYMDFDVIAYSDNAGNWGESSIHVYNVGLYRDDATDPTGWRVRIMSRNVFEEPYHDLTSLDADGISYLEPYRPLTYEELATLGDFSGRVLFATEMLYQENTTWVYIYLEESNEIIRKEIAYSNVEEFITAPPFPR